MQFDTSMIGTMNAGLAFGIFFMMFVVIFVAYTRRSRVPVRKMGNERVVVRRRGSITKDVAVLGLLFFVTAIVFGTLLVGYVVNAQSDDYESQDQIERDQLKQQLKDTILTVDLMAAQSQVSQYELDSLRNELEDAYTTLNVKKSKSRKVFIPIVPGPLY